MSLLWPSATKSIDRYIKRKLNQLRALCRLLPQFVKKKTFINIIARLCTRRRRPAIIPLFWLVQTVTKNRKKLHCRAGVRAVGAAVLSAVAGRPAEIRLSVVFWKCFRTDGHRSLRDFFFWDWKIRSVSKFIFLVLSTNKGGSSVISVAVEMWDFRKIFLCPRSRFSNRYRNLRR